MALTDKLTVIADAIRTKTGGTEELTLDQMATEISGIEVGTSGGEETCSIRISASKRIDCCTMTLLENGSQYPFVAPYNPETIDGVICGSGITLLTAGYGFCVPAVDNGVAELYTNNNTIFVFSAPTTPNVIGTIDLG